jgi:hypothetical protein
MTASGRSPTEVREAVSASSPVALCNAHTAVRRFARAAAAALPDHSWPATVSRSCGPGCKARKASNRLTGGWSESCSPSRSAATALSSRTCSMASGGTIESVGSRLDGDVLGLDPAGSYDASAKAAAEAFRRPGVLDAPCAVSYGPVPGSVYADTGFSTCSSTAGT